VEYYKTFLNPLIANNGHIRNRSPPWSSGEKAPGPKIEIFGFCLEKLLVNSDFKVSRYNHQSPMNNFTLNIAKRGSG
jgi:hypothetical protein